MQLAIREQTPETEFIACWMVCILVEFGVVHLFDVSAELLPSESLDEVQNLTPSCIFLLYLIVHLIVIYSY